MKETYVTYEQAQALKRLGFDWKCDANYTACNGTQLWVIHGREFINSDEFESPVAPTLNIAAKWLREVRRIYVFPDINCLKKWFAKAVDMESNEDLIWDGCMFNTYEDALSAGITKVLNLFEEK